MHKRHRCSLTASAYPDKGRAPSAIVAANPSIDWPGYAAMRHILAHQCFRRDPALIWAAIADELPALHAARHARTRSQGIVGAGRARQ